MRFFGLLSRLWASNPVKSHCNPPNRGGNSSQSRLRRFSQSYAIQMVLAQSMRITGGLCPWPQYQCRAGQCCNRRDAGCSDMVLTIQVDPQSKQPKFDVFIFRNPAAIQFSFFAIHDDCRRIAGLPNSCRL